MENISLIEKIKSQYIANKIFSYVKDSDYLLKLAKYCKRLQNSFNLGIEDYKAKSFEKNCKKLENFLYVKRSSKFKINYLKNKFKMDYDENIGNTILNEFSEIYFTNKYKFYQSNEQIKKNIIDNQLLIDIQSPFYKNLLKNPIFPNLFIIRIPLPLIKEQNLMNDYIKEFEILNKSNTNYSALCFQFDHKTRQYPEIEKFNIDYQKIKKLIFEEKNMKIKKQSSNFDKSNEFLLFTTIFSNSNIVNNLIFLEIKNLRNTNDCLYDLKNINNFKSLEELRLENVIFSKDLLLKLNSLKYLSLCNCNQIAISKNCASNIKSLSLFRSMFKRLNQTDLQFPELEQLKLSFCYYNCQLSGKYQPNYYIPFFFQELKEAIDLKSLKKLKYLLRGDVLFFLALENNSLEKAYISSFSSEPFTDLNDLKQTEKNMIKKFIDIKTLKEIKLSLYFINSNDLESIEGENTSVKKLIIDLHKNKDDDNDNLLYNLQKKFPNLTEIEIYDYSIINKINLEPNCKIERLKYSRNFDIMSHGITEEEFINKNINKEELKKVLAINLFENLKDLELRNITKINIPFFNDICKYNFKSLTKFHLDNSNIKSAQIDLKVINNIIENINTMPNLKCFIFKCYSSINKKEYYNLVTKILKLKIKSIEFGINSFTEYDGFYGVKRVCNDEYSHDYLRLLYENVDFKYFDNLKIYKFNEYYNYNKYKI